MIFQNLFINLYRTIQNSMSRYYHKEFYSNSIIELILNMFMYEL